MRPAPVATRSNPGLRRRLTARARRLPLRESGLVLVGAAIVWSLATGAAGAGVLGLVALAALLGDRFVWRHTRTQALRSRYRALGARAEALDARLAALRESEAVHRSLTETFGDLAVQLAPARDGGSGTITFANAGFRAMFPGSGTLPVDVRGDDASGEDEVETTLGRKVLQWRALPALDGRGRPALRWIARDVTEAVDAREAARREAERAEAHAASKGRFLAMAAHEIRNPLNGIAGMAELLATAGLDSHAAAHVDAIRRSTAALGSVLDDLLDDARMEAGRLSVENEPFELGPVLENVCELAAPYAHEKGLDLASHVVAHGEEAVPLRIDGDAHRVRQIVSNLVGNALKFTQAGGINVLARAVRGPQGTATLRVEVRDTGPGLTAEEAERIFDVFESGGDEEATRRLARRLGGVGLGLAISRRLAAALGGTLEVESRPGEGATFTLALPLVDAGEPPAEGDALAGRGVLLVCESPVLAAPLRRFVEERGGRLSIMEPASFTERMRHRRPWDAGPVLLDGEIENAPADAVRLVRDAGLRAPAARWLRLPWRAASLERALSGAPHVDAVEPPVLRPALDTGGTGERVLVAEDDPVTQLLATAVLERAGHRVTLAPTGHEAARLYREAAEAVLANEEGAEPFAMVLIDVNLTVSGEEGMDGMAALAAIRAIEKARGLARVPLHVVTGDTRPQTADAAREAGATSVLLKPVPVPVLAALLPPVRTEPRREEAA